MEENFSANAALPNEDALVVHIASRANRMLNFGLDMAMISVGFYMLASWVSHQHGLEWLAPELLTSEANRFSLRTKLVMAGFAGPYYFFFEYFLGKTPAKFITRTRVIRAEDGEAPYAWQILLRTLLRFMPAEFLWYIIAPSGPHDFMSQTVVVEEESPGEAEA